MSELKGKRVVVLGLGASGVAAAQLCVRRGAHVIGADSKPYEALSEQARALERLGIDVLVGPQARSTLDRADLVVVSPGVPPSPEMAVAEKRGVPIWGEVELAVRSLAHEAPIVAVGGTNGKSTTTTLIGALLEANGLRTFLGGNLGEPLASRVDEAFDVIVLEVSSFQMERVDRFRPHVSALLNVTADHLDRYADFAEYARAKGNAFVRQTADDWAVVPAADPVCAREAARGRAKVVTFGAGGIYDVTRNDVIDSRSGVRFPRADIRLTGGHNALNVAAALACVAPFAVSVATIRSVLATFGGLPHRTALVAEVRGVRYYDDSKGTNVGAAVTALEGLAESKAVLIAGGRDKGGAYSPLVEALVRKGRAAVLLGEASEAIAKAIAGRVPVHRASGMKDAVRASAQLALPGDAVLLSPACSSFDMFRDYKHRGEEFASAVSALALEEGR